MNRKKKFLSIRTHDVVGAMEVLAQVTQSRVLERFALMDAHELERHVKRGDGHAGTLPAGILRSLQRYSGRVLLQAAQRVVRRRAGGT